jgi:CRISPR-associated exonuclease Cas4
MLLPVMEPEEAVPLSYLSQYGYCPRRAGLLLLDQAWAESADTAEGEVEHARVHTQRIEKRGDFLKLYEYPVFSRRLGLKGLCDCIEARKSESGASLPNLNGCWKLYPIEYKHGAVRNEREYELQLCGQAICLEEQFHLSIPEGSLFYLNAHRRLPVPLNRALRRETEDTAAALIRMLKSGKVPEPEPSAKCRKCSLQGICMPKAPRSASAYCSGLAEELAEGEQR